VPGHNHRRAAVTPLQLSVARIVRCLGLLAMNHVRLPPPARLSRIGPIVNTSGPGERQHVTDALQPLSFFYAEPATKVLATGRDAQR
jgi:hypothetical protein